MADQDPISEFIALPRDQQLSTLQKLSPEKQDKLLAQVQQRHTPSKAEPAPRAQPEARTAGNYASEIARGVGRGVKNDVTGTAQMIRHPNETMKAGSDQAKAADVAGEREFKDTKGASLPQRVGAYLLTELENAPIIGGMVQHAEEGGTKPGSPESFGAAAEGVTTIEGPNAAVRGARALAPRIAETVTGTGPGVTKDLVKDTKASNTARDAYSDTHASVETAREKALKVGNEKFNAVNEKLNPLPADMEKVHGLYFEAAESFGEPQAQPALINRLGKALQNNAELTYKDEQALYSELGKELSKGTLPGTTYHAYDVLHEGLGNDMQRIADSKGQGAELTAARQYWRRMKQTFGKPYSPTDAASKTLTGTSPEIAESAARANRVRMLGSFDSEIPGKFSRLDAATEAAKGKLAPEKIGAADVQAAKAKSLGKRADLVRHKALWIAAGPPIYAIVDMMRGHVPNMGEVAGVSAGIGGISAGIGSLLEKPAVVDFLTKATDRDIATIPEDLRGDFPQIVRQAQSKGVKVAPALARMAQGAAALAPRKPEQNATDEWQGIEP